MIGRRFVESEAYRKARAAGAFAAVGRIPDDLLDGVELLSEAELHAELHLRTFSDVTPFAIEGVPYVGELPAVAGIPALVETIPVTKFQVLLGDEAAEAETAGPAADGQRLPEGSADFGAAATLTKLPRFGSAAPATKSVFDEPGRVASLLDRRIRLGFTLGLEREILTGAGGFWPGILGMPTSATGDASHTIAVAKGAGYRVEAIVTGLAKVQDNGWYVGQTAMPMASAMSSPAECMSGLNVISHPDTKLATYLERDTSARPAMVRDMLRGQVDNWLVSKFMPVGTALVGDFFDAVALFTHGGLSASLGEHHLDFYARGMVQLMLVTRAYAWVRQAGAISVVTGL
jgi:hypothetical protein